MNLMTDVFSDKYRRKIIATYRQISSNIAIYRLVRTELYCDTSDCFQSHFLANIEIFSTFKNEYLRLEFNYQIKKALFEFFFWWRSLSLGGDIETNSAYLRATMAFLLNFFLKLTFFLAQGGLVGT